MISETRRTVIIGSSEFWGLDSEAICREIGRSLVTIPDLALITGGMPAVGEVVGRSYWEESRRAGRIPGVYHILPHGFGGPDYGRTIHVGATMIDRREVLARLAKVIVAVEGGPGTEYEARVAREQGAILIPVGRSGGCASELHTSLECPIAELQDQWQRLGDSSLDAETIGIDVRQLVASAIELGV